MKNNLFGFIAVLLGVFFVFSTLPALSQQSATQLSQSKLPPGKLIRQDVSRPNPLRSAPPAVSTSKIKQMSLQSEEIAADPLPAAPAQPMLPQSDPFASPLAEPPLQGKEIAAKPAEPKPAVEPQSAEPGMSFPPLDTTTQNNASLDSVPQPSVPESPSPLGSASPFALEQPQASVPPDALPAAAESPLEPALEHASEQPLPEFIDQQRPLMSTPALQQPASEGTGMPGHSALEGEQTPHLTIQKVLPAEVVLDQPATLKTVIQNVGKSAAKNVTITDQVPQGTRLLSTIPDAALGADGTLSWSVGNLDPNVQLIIEMKVLPLREGEIGSVASINYTGEASGRIAVTRPMLKVEVKAPAELQLGEVANVEITVSNPGTATATNIVLEERVPEGLYHKDGRVMQHKGITALRPKESKKLTLPLTCIGAGNLVNHIVVTADGNLKAEDKTTIRASAPVLSLEIVGAQKRFLERPSDYRLIVANKGNASAHNVNLELALPSAVKFVSTNQSGVYEPTTHTVHWALEELPPQEAGEIELNILPAQTGEHSLRFSGLGENNLKAEAKLPMIIDGIPAITFEIVGDATLVEIGKDAVYEIRVVNRGTKAAENVKVWATLAEGMQFVKAEGARYQVQDGTIQFEAIPQLAAKSENVYKLSTRCQKEGDYRLNVQVISDDLRLPIAKEESTKVFR